MTPTTFHPVDEPSSSGRRPVVVRSTCRRRPRDDRTKTARANATQKNSTYSSRAFARLRVSRVAFARVTENPNRIPAPMHALECARAHSRSRRARARTGERHDDIVEKKISVCVRSFVRSFARRVRSRARACDDDDVTERGTERAVRGNAVRDAMDVSSSMGVYIDRLRGTQMSDRQMHKKQNPQKVPR